MDPITLGLAGVGLGTSLFGQWKAGQERKKMNNQIGQWEGENKAFYNSRALGDYTQRADAQNAIRQMREQLDRQTKRATNTQAITGGTVEQTAVAKDSANKALADTTSNIAAVGQQFKDKVTDQYMNRKNQLGMMKYDNMKGDAQSGEALAQTGLNTAAGALSSLVQKPTTAGLTGTTGGTLGADPGKIAPLGVKPLTGATPKAFPSKLINPLINK